MDSEEIYILADLSGAPPTPSLTHSAGEKNEKPKK